MNGHVSQYHVGPSRQSHAHFLTSDEVVENIASLELVGIRASINSCFVRGNFGSGWSVTK